MVNEKLRVMFYPWAVSLLAIPLLSIFGRPLQLALYESVSLSLLSFCVYSLLAACVLSYLVLLQRAGGFVDSWHLLWLAGLTWYCYGNLHFVEKIHLLLFGTFGFLSYLLFSRKTALLAGISLSLLDELLQYFLASRVGDWRDVRLNLFSVFLGMFLAFLLQKNCNKEQIP